MLDIFFDVDKHGAVLKEIVDYLEKFPHNEEGGILIGKRIINGNRLDLNITRFVPIKNNIKSWDIDPTITRVEEFPEEEYGYFPNPNDYFVARMEIFPSNENSDEMEIGFAHSHMQYLPNPSSWDLNKVNKKEGWLMPIYSNRTKQLKIWYVTNNETEGQQKWESKKSQSSAQVELAAIYANK